MLGIEYIKNEGLVNKNGICWSSTRANEKKVIIQLKGFNWNSILIFFKNLRFGGSSLLLQDENERKTTD